MVLNVPIKMKTQIYAAPAVKGLKLVLLAQFVFTSIEKCVRSPIIINVQLAKPGFLCILIAVPECTLYRPPL